MTVEDIKKGAAVLAILIVSIPALLGCAPELAHASPTDTIAISQSPTPKESDALSTTPEVKSTPTPTSVPELSYEEEIKIIGCDPSIKDVMAATISGIYYEGEEIDANGKTNIVQRIAFVYLRDIPQTKDLGIHIMFNNIMIFKVIDHPSNYSTSNIPSMKPLTINENLKNIKVIEGFDIHELKIFCKKRGIALKESEAFDKLTNYIETNGLEAYLLKPYTVPIEDFLQIYLALPKEYRVAVSETIIADNALPEETVNPTSYRPYTSKDGASNINYPFKRITQPEVVVDENVIHGYRTPGYYGPTHTVVAVKHLDQQDQQDQHTKTKI